MVVVAMRDRSLCLHKSKKKIAKPMRERERQIGREREEKQSIYVRTYVAGETSRG